jgi:hypothetical protein
MFDCLLHGMGGRGDTADQARGWQTCVRPRPQGDPIKVVFSALRRICACTESAGAFELRSAFPARVYDENNDTMLSLDFVPNATLLLKATKSPETSSL